MLSLKVPVSWFQRLSIGHPLSEFDLMKQSINTYNILETLLSSNGGESCSNIGSAVTTKAIPVFYFCR